MRNTHMLHTLMKGTFGDRHKFLSPRAEAQNEAKSFFVVNRASNAALLAERGIAEIDNVLAISMGSSSTQWYWIEKNEGNVIDLRTGSVIPSAGIIKSDCVPLGTTDFIKPHAGSSKKIFSFSKK